MDSISRSQNYFVQYLLGVFHFYFFENYHYVSHTQTNPHPPKSFGVLAQITDVILNYEMDTLFEVGMQGNFLIVNFRPHPYHWNKDRYL